MAHPIVPFDGHETDADADAEANGAAPPDEVAEAADDDPLAKAKAELSVMRRTMETISKLPREGQHRVLTWLRSTMGAE